MTLEERRKEHFSRSDRDLLITLHEEVKGLRADISDMKDGVKATLLDHETRLRSLEKYVWLAIGALFILQVASPLIIKLIYQ